jgi:hypothetical protein
LGTRLAVFENSSDAPFLEEPDAFYRELEESPPP